MTCTIQIDWKFVAALGASAVALVLTCKVDSSTAKEVLTQGVGACKDCVVAYSSNAQPLC